MVAPDVDRHQARGVVGVQPAGRALDVVDLGLVAPVAWRSRRTGSRRRSTGAASRCARPAAPGLRLRPAGGESRRTSCRLLRPARCSARRGSRRGPGVRAGAGSTGCWERTTLAWICSSSPTMRSSSDGRERVAVADGVGLHRGAVQPQELAVEVHVAAVPGELAQAHVGDVGALAGNFEGQVVEVGVRRRPQRGVRDRDGGGGVGGLPVFERERAEAQRDLFGSPR